MIDRAMAGLKGSRILIIDNRRNGGGDPTSVAYLVSYLLAPGQPIAINEFVVRTPGTISFTRESFRTQRAPINFAGVPVYVLTSKNTFSGGEEFAYDVQALRRATIVGEVTGGGANPVRRLIWATAWSPRSRSGAPRIRLRKRTGRVAAFSPTST